MHVCTLCDYEYLHHFHYCLVLQFVCAGKEAFHKAVTIKLPYICYFSLQNNRDMTNACIFFSSGKKAQVFPAGTKLFGFESMKMFSLVSPLQTTNTRFELIS